MKVLVADKFEQSGLEGLAAAGCEVVFEPELQREALVAAISSTRADVLVVRSTQVTAPMFDAGSLSLVVRAGAGYNTIDVEGASRRGIYVANCPGRNAIAVAELAFGLILALDRRIPDNVAMLRAGIWSKKEFSQAKGLYGRTLGLLGAGAISVEMIRRAAGFGLNVILWSRRFDGASRALTDEEAGGLGIEAEHRKIRIDLAPTPCDVAAAADILSVHLALGAGTRGLINEDLLERMRPGSIFLNTARGEVVDYGALAEVTRRKGLRVGLDVFAQEPAGGSGAFSDPLIALPGVYGTHHIGASTEQAQEAVAAETVRIVSHYRETGKVLNVVNLARRSPATHCLIVRHRDRPGVLAHVFQHLGSAHLNVQETENIVFDGAEAAVARINLDRAPSRSTCEQIIEGNSDILDLQVIEV